MAAFASHPWHRVRGVQTIVAVVTSFVLSWFLSQRIFPVIRQALHQIPPGTALEAGHLVWKGESPAILAENPWFAIVVDLEHSGSLGQVADLQFEAGLTGERVRSLLGYLFIPHPSNGSHDLGAVALSSWWGAREPMVLVAFFFGSGMVLMLNWHLIALFYAAPVRFIAFLGDRQADWVSARKLAGASLMPGALFLSTAIVFYGVRMIPLVGLVSAFILHFFVGWLFLLSAPFHLRPITGLKQKGNPFKGSGRKD